MKIFIVYDPIQEYYRYFFTEAKAKSFITSIVEETGDTHHNNLIIKEGKVE